jgi:tetratricopeptide (TPR) repeat protein
LDNISEQKQNLKNMPENNKTEEFLKKLAPCIERGKLEACVEEAARVAREMGIGAEELLDLLVQEGNKGKHACTFVLALAAVPGLEGDVKAMAYYDAGLAAWSLKKVEKAEKYYLGAIKANPDLAVAHFNYAILLKDMKRFDEAEKQYQEAIKANPNYAEAHFNYAILLEDLKQFDEAEKQYLEAIKANPNDAEVRSNYAILLEDLKQFDEAEKQYQEAIKANPNYAEAHFNYAILLTELKHFDEAEKQYLEAIKANPNYAEAYSNYAHLLKELNRKEEAEEHFKKAIEVGPKHANAHGAYGLLLIEFDRRDEAWKETEKASNIFKETGNITQSYLAKAWFYERYSEKNINRKKFRESGEDAEKAGDEYLNASETTEGDLKDDLALQGNVLKAKSFVRKIPEKSWYRKILNRFGKNPDISELMDNLSEAAKYYEKASQCSAGERKDICSACFSSIRVFSEILLAMSALIKNDDAEIDKDKWLSSLELSHKIYNEKKLNNGAALVDTLKQLIKCVDELAEHRKMGLHIQEEKLGKCYNNLLEVSEKLDGALKVITEHSVEAIRDYARKQGMGFIGEETKKSFLGEWIKEIRAAAAVIIAAAVMDKIFSLNLSSKLVNLIKSIITGLGNQ